MKNLDLFFILISIFVIILSIASIYYANDIKVTDNEVCLQKPKPPKIPPPPSTETPKGDTAPHPIPTPKPPSKLI